MNVLIIILFKQFVIFGANKYNLISLNSILICFDKTKHTEIVFKIVSASQYKFSTICSNNKVPSLVAVSSTKNQNLNVWILIIINN